MRVLIPASTLFLAIVVSLPADGAITIYTDRASFDAATTNRTLLDFEAQQTHPDTGVTIYPGGLTIGDVTFTEFRLAVLAPSVYDTVNASNYLNRNPGFQDLVVSFAAPVYAAGMDLGYVDNWGYGPTTVTMTLSNGDVATTSHPQIRYEDLAFYGFVSDTPFDNIVMDDPTFTTAIDNFAYTTAGAIPEPSTLAIWSLLGALGLTVGWWRRRR